jgi:hypothetical protein
MSPDDRTTETLDGTLQDNDVIKRPNWRVGIRALVVLDGRPSTPHYASFGQGDLSTDPFNGDAFFGLSEFIHTLSVSTPHFARVSVTKAHRDTDVRGAAHIEHYRFDQHDLSLYDVIFLFGVASLEETEAMSDAELIALATFMDGGGGVFATGDHEDLGVELNGHLPRVRSMRKWHLGPEPPLGAPEAPPALGVERIDTTQPGHNESFAYFDNQSDDIPQPLEVRRYSRQEGPLRERTYPHPLLCGPRGTIEVMPDHMHEGEVIEPWDPDAKLTFGGTSFVEYPRDARGVRPLPEIIAWGEVLAERNISTEPTHAVDDAVARARSFGVVGAYDGHRAGVGRVAVHSTWHHFFDINLIGDPVAPFPKTQGFNASPAGIEALEDIRSYYRNLVTWLARPRTQMRMFASAAWHALHAQPLNMIVNPRQTYSHDDLMRIGTLAESNILRSVPQCSVIVWTWTFPYLVDGDPQTSSRRTPGQGPVLETRRLSIRRCSSERRLAVRSSRSRRSASG